MEDHIFTIVLTIPANNETEAQEEINKLLKDYTFTSELRFIEGDNL